MSAAVARQGGQVQLEQSDIHLILNMATMAKERFLHATIRENKFPDKDTSWQGQRR